MKLLTRHIWFILLSSVSVFCVADGDEMADDVTAEVIDELPVNSGASAKEIDVSVIEKAVMPLTHWVEGKIQDHAIAKPQKSHNKSNDLTNGISLRDAIRKATQQYAGTVLSAEQVQKNNQRYYRIKMLSANGVVKIIEVNGQSSVQQEP